MKFYGAEQALVAWKEILINVLYKECGQVEPDCPVRHYFEVELNEEELQFLQKNYWYEVQVGQDLPWNQRISFLK